MYYFFSIPNLHLFNQFDDQALSSIIKFENDLISISGNSTIIESLNVISANTNNDENNNEPELHEIDIFFNDYLTTSPLNKIHPFEMFAKLVTALPYLPFLKVKLNNNTSFKNRFIDYLNIKHILNFKLDLKAIKVELDKLSDTGDYIVNHNQIYNDLLKIYYKYGFINIAENLKIETDQRIFNLNINSLLKSYKLEYKRYYSKDTNNKEFSSAEKFLLNLQNSIKQHEFDSTIAVLNEMKLYSNTGFVKEMFARIFIENIKPKAPIRKRIYHSDLRYFFLAIIRELFYEHKDLNIAPDELANLQKKLFNKNTILIYPLKE